MLPSDTDKIVRAFPKNLLKRLDEINISEICSSCSSHGCINADDKPVPCLCDGDCAHDQECICQCHDWDSAVYMAKLVVQIAFDEMGINYEK